MDIWACWKLLKNNQAKGVTQDPIQVSQKVVITLLCDFIFMDIQTCLASIILVYTSELE